MTGLRDELHRIGDTAPTIDVPDDTWVRARRARHRDRALVLASAAAVLAVVVGLAMWRPGLSTPQPAGTGQTGVPETIWAVPEGVFTRADAAEDLAVGRAAVAMLTENGIPVVIGAADGVYHPLRLPGYGAFQVDQGVLSLSPDGRHLAWPWSGKPGDGTAQTPTGIRIVDLETGQQRSIPLTGGEGVAVYQILWSPDSSWVVWDGNDAAQWEGRGYKAGDEAAGRIAPGATSSEEIPRSNDESTTFAIGNDGAVLIATMDHQTLWDGDTVETLPRPDGWYPEAVTTRNGVLLETIEHAPSADTYTTDYRVVKASGPVPAPALAQTQLVSLGVIDGLNLVALTQHVGATGSHLSLVDLTAGGALSDVGEVDGNGQITVAVDLMSTEHPTVSRPEPEWLEADDSGVPTTWLLLGGALVVLVAGGSALLLRRRQRSAR